MTIHLVTTSDVKGNRRGDLIRLHQTVAASSIAISEEVRLSLLLQNCTAEECEAYRDVAPAYCSVTSIPGSCSLSAARNHLLRVIQSKTPLLDHDIVGFPDDDCWFPADFLPSLSLAFRDRADLEVLFCRSSCHPDEGAFFPDEMVTASIPQIVRLSSSNNVFYRASALRAVGLFDPDLGLGTPIGGSEDTDYIIRCALAVGACSFIDRRLVGHAEPNRASAVKYFRGSLVVLTRYADRQPRLLLEFLRKICVGLVFAMQGSISFEYLVGSFVLGLQKRAFVAERIGS